MKKQYDLIILGAGPAGIATALSCQFSIDNILLIDKNAVIGKKILSTGNGKCNLTNLNQYKEAYRSDNMDKAWQIICQYPTEQYLASLSQVGIVTKDKNGYIYPYSEQASSVREAMEQALMAAENIQILAECQVLDLRKTSGKYQIKTTKGVFQGKTILLSMGGKAAPKLGSDGDGYELAEKMGHKMIQTLPALTALKSGAPFLKKVSGVRNQSKISLYVNDSYVSAEYGELQWTDYGVSGVAVFQLSRYAIRALEEGCKVELSLDFMPDNSMDTLKECMDKLCRQCPYKSVSQLLHGFLPLKLCAVVAREARLKEDSPAGALRKEEKDKLCQSLKYFSLRINGYMGYDKAQVTQGGVSLSETDDFLQSTVNAGMFFAGEILDVDGTCGGYNLQWAYSSGRRAAEGIIRYIN